MNDDNYPWLLPAILIGFMLGLVLVAIYLRVVHGSWMGT